MLMLEQQADVSGVGMPISVCQGLLGDPQKMSLLPWGERRQIPDLHFDFCFSMDAHGGNQALQSLSEGFPGPSGRSQAFQHEANLCVEIPKILAQLSQQ